MYEPLYRAEYTAGCIPAGTYIAKNIIPEMKWQMNLPNMPAITPEIGWCLNKPAKPNAPNARGQSSKNWAG